MAGNKISPKIAGKGTVFQAFLRVSGEDGGFPIKY